MKNEKSSDDTSDMDEPMASQSIDSEAPLTHNSSKSNFFTMADDSTTAMMGSVLSSTNQKTSQQMQMARDSPQSKYNPQYAKGSPHPGQR